MNIYMTLKITIFCIFISNHHVIRHVKKSQKGLFKIIIFKCLKKLKIKKAFKLIIVFENLKSP